MIISPSHTQTICKNWLTHASCVQVNATHTPPSLCVSQHFTILGDDSSIIILITIQILTEYFHFRSFFEGFKNCRVCLLVLGVLLHVHIRIKLFFVPMLRKTKVDPDFSPEFWTIAATIRPCGIDSMKSMNSWVTPSSSEWVAMFTVSNRTPVSYKDTRLKSSTFDLQKIARNSLFAM